MNRFLWLGLLVVAIFLVGCPINPPDTENTNITIEDIEGEWDFSNVKIGTETYDSVHVSILPAAHGDSPYQNGVDITIGDYFIMSDGNFSDNVYTGIYGYKESEGWIETGLEITVTFSLIDGKLKMKVQAGNPFGSFTIEGGKKPASYSEVIGTWKFTNVSIPNQPGEVGPSTFTTCTLKVEPYIDQYTYIETMHLTGVDNHGYTCNYDGQIVGAGGVIYQYSYNYDIKDAGGNLKAESDYAKTITVKFFLTEDGKLFVEFDSEGQLDPSPLDGVMLTYGEKQA
ncbi:MAG: hypothetical protein ABFC86_02995 [Rectinema sp.]